MSDKQLIKLMDQLKESTGPSDSWVGNTRRVLLAQMPETKIDSFWLRTATRLMPVNLAVRPVAVFSLVIGLFVLSSFASVNASRNSLPGDVLYPVKLTAENLKYTLSFSNTSKAKVAMTRVENRIGELKKISNLDEPAAEKQIKISQATSEIKDNLKLMTDKLQSMDKTNKEGGVKITMAAQEINAKILLAKEEIKIAMDLTDTDLDLGMTEVNQELDKASAEVATVLKEIPVAGVNENNENGIVQGSATSTNTSTINVLNNNEVEAGTSSDEFIKQLIVETNNPEPEPEFKVGIMQ